MNPPVEALFEQVRGRDGAVLLHGDGWTRTIVAWEPDEVFAAAGDWTAAGRRLSGSGLCAGYVGYGAGVHVDAFAPSAPTREPETWLARYGGWITVDAHGTYEIHGAERFRRDAARVLAAAVPLSPPAPAEPVRVTTVDRERYHAAIAAILRWIRDGEVYQVNLARHVDVHGVRDAWAAWRRLQAITRPRFGAFLRVDPSMTVLSASPELFLRGTGRTLESLPIKGTRPRSDDPDDDARAAAELERSEKDRAELAMIVDLVRNDLGRVAAPGSVSWAPRTLFTTPYVHHAAQAVRATLADGRDIWDALGASFPPGSVTGAPKIRACAKIAALEAEPRGVYCGTIGYVLGDEACFNVAIRTATWTAEPEPRMRYFVGGGVVADSSPHDEWDETVAKAAGLAAAFGEPTRKTTKRPSPTPTS